MSTQKLPHLQQSSVIIYFFLKVTVSRRLFSFPSDDCDQDHCDHRKKKSSFLQIILLNNQRPLSSQNRKWFSKKKNLTRSKKII